VARAFFDLGEFNISLVECPVRSASQPCGCNAERGYLSAHGTARRLYPLANNYAQLTQPGVYLGDVHASVISELLTQRSARMSGLDAERKADTFLGHFTMLVLRRQKNRTGIGAHPGCEKAEATSRRISTPQI
jgi:hypothetical protein